MDGITLGFWGAEYRIPEEKAFEVADRLEDIVTLGELMSWGDKPKFVKIAKAYGMMLRFAGCKVSDADVHGEMMAQVKALAVAGSGSNEAAQEILATKAVGALVAILMDGAPQGGGDPAGKTSAS